MIESTSGIILLVGGSGDLVGREERRGSQQWEVECSEVRAL